MTNKEPPRYYSRLPGRHSRESGNLVATYRVLCRTKAGRVGGQEILAFVRMM